MKIISPELIAGKDVLLRYDFDVTLKDGQVDEPYRLEAGLPTLKMCLENANKVIIMGHLGRPKGQDPNLSVAPIVKWFETRLAHIRLPKHKFSILENLRFEEGEESSSLEYAKSLASLGNFYVNEAFASYRPSASTTVLPTLLPHAAGLRFAKEVEMLSQIRNNPSHPFVVVMGGAKLEEKLPAVKVLSTIADQVLVGGKLAAEMRAQNISLPNVDIADLIPDGEDITQETVLRWQQPISNAKLILDNGPLGKVEDPKNNQTLNVLKLIAQSEAVSVIGGGDSIAYLNKEKLLDKFSYVCTGGGAMLKFIEDGTLDTIKALD